MNKEIIERATVRIICSNEDINCLDLNELERGADFEIGTGFFIDDNKVITASHVVQKYFDNKWSIYIDAINAEAEKVISAIPINDKNSKIPIIILELDEKINIETLKFTYNYKIKKHDIWESFGHPQLRWDKGHWQDGTVTRKLNEFNSSNANYDLDYNDKKINNFHGLSGAPFIINEMILGVMIEQSQGNGKAISLGVITIEKFKDQIDAIYTTKNIHKEKAKSIVRKLSEKQIKTNKDSKKYIPNLYTTINEVDEFARYFTDPIRFFEKLIEDVANFKFNNIKYYFDVCGIKEVRLIEAYDLLYDCDINNIEKHVLELQKRLSKRVYEIYNINLEEEYPANMLFKCNTDREEFVSNREFHTEKIFYDDMFDDIEVETIDIDDLFNNINIGLDNFSNTISFKNDDMDNILENNNDIQNTNLFERTDVFEDDNLAEENTLNENIGIVGNVEISTENCRKFKAYKSDIKYTFEEILEKNIKEFLKYLYTIKCKILLLTEKAGQGKTNFLCNLVENNLLKKHINCIFVNAKEIDANNITQSFTDLLCLNSIDKFNELLDILNEISDEESKPCIIIVDGLNENHEIVKFSKNIILFIRNILKYKNFKIIITCREEYFNERFIELEKEFSTDLIRINRFNKSMNRLERKKNIDKYLKAYDINLINTSSYVYHQFTNELLLLRYFCESYKGETLNSIDDIYIYNMFDHYFNKKLEEIKNKASIDIKDNKAVKFKEFMNVLIDYMIENTQFSNISKSVLNTGYEEICYEIISEDIIIKEDILVGNCFVKEVETVISFTYDEFRDFLLARRLLMKFHPKKEDECRKLVEKITNNECTVAEGVSKYLFFVNKENNIKEFNNILESQKWYEKIYFDNIFSVKDNYITNQDIKKINTFIFNNLNVDRDSYVCGKMYFQIICRFNISIYKNLNVEILLDKIEYYHKIGSIELLQYILNDLIIYCRRESGFGRIGKSKVSNSNSYIIIDVLYDILEKNINNYKKYRYLLWVSMAYFDTDDQTYMNILEKYFSDYNTQFIMDYNEFISNNNKIREYMDLFAKYLYKRKIRYSIELQERIEYISENRIYIIR